MPLKACINGCIAVINGAFKELNVINIHHIAVISLSNEFFHDYLNM
jgi:hypothetical protein